jgi:hypothetical protein
MDISRLPVAPLVRPASAAYKSAPQAASVETVVAVESSRNTSRSSERFERVVQGELLQRERGSYQSTRAFIDERALDHAVPSERQASGGRQSRSAVSLYLNNTRPETAADLTQGRSVNFFV